MWNLESAHREETSWHTSSEAELWYPSFNKAFLQPCAKENSLEKKKNKTKQKTTTNKNLQNVFLALELKG